MKRRKLVPFTAGMLGLALAVGTVASAKKVQLQVWDWYKDRMDLLKPKVEAYQKLNPNVEIKMSITDWGTYPSKVLASVIGGAPPDIIQFHNSWTGQLIKVLAPFPPEYFPTSRMSDEYYQFNTAFRMKDGKFYFFPDGVMTSLIFYNTRLWSQAGLASTPRTWDEMRMVAKKLTQVDNAGKITIGGFFFTPYLLFDDINYQNGGSIYNDNHTGVSWNTDEGRKAISLVGNMAISDGIRPLAGAFETNKTAMQYNWTWYKSGLLKLPAQKLSWATFPIPTSNGGDTDIRARNNYECGYAVTANARGGKKNEAFRFLKWLYSDDNWYVKLNDVMGRFPGKKSLWTRPELVNDVVHKSLAKQVPYTMFPGERPAWIDTALGTMESDILSKKLSPLEALKKAQTEGDKQWKIQPPKWIVEKRLPK